MSSKLEPTTAKPRLPRQIGYIIGNEACERFSFYGMRNILTPFLAGSALLFGSAIVGDKEREAAAKEVFHTFVIGVYFFPLLGGWLSDRFLGKYRTIFWLSIVYGIGSILTAYYVDSKSGFYAGLFLIALGSGGIKPCVSAFVGDQFDQSNKSLAKVVFDAFYWIINFGSFFASAFMPWTLRHYGPHWAFGIPAVLMFISTLVFWLGRSMYVRVPPAPPNPDSFLRVVRSALVSRGLGFGSLLAAVGIAVAVLCLVLAVFQALRAGGLFDLWERMGWPHLVLSITQLLCLGIVALISLVGIGARLQLHRALDLHPPEAVNGATNVLSILVLFFLVTPFWSLFDQKASTWVLQANAMTKPDWFEPAQMQLVNPALVMLMIPFNNLVLYPWLRRLGFEPTALRRMGWGIAFAGFAWVVVSFMQLVIDRKQELSIVWQLAPYVLLTFGEVLVSATGLEFAYSQAPPSMKGAIMAFWSLSVTIGNLWVLLINTAFQREGVTNLIKGSGLGTTAFQMFFFAGMAFVAALAFGLYAARYTPADHYRQIDPTAS